MSEWLIYSSLQFAIPSPIKNEKEIQKPSLNKEIDDAWNHW